MMDKKPYIGRQVKHFEKVDPKSIKAEFSECKLWRYSLEMTYLDEPGRDKHLSIILKNPSSADEQKADKTIATAEQYIYRFFPDVKRLSVLNIYAYRATLAKDIAGLIKEEKHAHAVGDRNDGAITQCLERSDYVLIAWGGNSGIRAKSYEGRVQEVLAFVKEAQKPVFRNPQKGSERFPFHACYWSYEVPPCEVLL